jgi:hypothetical protein
MAELGNYQVDPNNTEQSFDPLPAGDYIAVIEASDWKSTKTGSGRYLNLQYQVIDGPFKGRKLFNIINLENPSQDATQIARQTLNSIGVACNVMQLQDSAQLHNIPMKIKVVFKEDPVYGPKNEIKGHKPIGQTAPPVQQQAPPVQQQPQSQPQQQQVAPAQDEGVPAARPWEV